MGDGYIGFCTLLDYSFYAYERYGGSQFSARQAAARAGGGDLPSERNGTLTHIAVQPYLWHRAGP